MRQNSDNGPETSPQSPVAEARSPQDSAGERVFLGLGSNLGDCEHQLRCALAALRARGYPLVQCSAVYETPPWGIAEQPAFLNQVAEVRSAAEPMALLRELLAIESELGRERSLKWGPRAIDLDILAFGQCQRATAELCLPHPQLQERAFVLVPWAEIAPAFRVPGLGRSVAELLTQLRQREPAEVAAARQLRTSV